MNDTSTYEWTIIHQRKETSSQRACPTNSHWKGHSKPRTTTPSRRLRDASTQSRTVPCTRISRRPNHPGLHHRVGSEPFIRRLLAVGALVENQILNRHLCGRWSRATYGCLRQSKNTPNPYTYWNPCVTPAQRCTGLSGCSVSTSSASSQATTRMP